MQHSSQHMQRTVWGCRATVLKIHTAFAHSESHGARLRSVCTPRKILPVAIIILLHMQCPNPMFDIPDELRPMKEMVRSGPMSTSIIVSAEHNEIFFKQFMSSEVFFSQRRCYSGQLLPLHCPAGWLPRAKRPIRRHVKRRLDFLHTCASTRHKPSNKLNSASDSSTFEQYLVQQLYLYQSLVPANPLKTANTAKYPGTAFPSIFYPQCFLYAASFAF